MLGEPVKSRRGEHLADRSQRIHEILGIAVGRRLMPDVREHTTAIDDQHGGRGPDAALQRRADDAIDVARLRLARHQERNERHDPRAHGMVRRHNG